MQTVAELGPRLGVRPTCTALGVAAASYYRWLTPRAPARPRASPRALSPAERQAVLDVLQPLVTGPLNPGHQYVR